MQCLGLRVNWNHCSFCTGEGGACLCFVLQITLFMRLLSQPAIWSPVLTYNCYLCKLCQRITEIWLVFEVMLPNTEPIPTKHKTCINHYHTSKWKKNMSSKTIHVHVSEPSTPPPFPHQCEYNLEPRSRGTYRFPPRDPRPPHAVARLARELSLPVRDLISLGIVT